MGQSDTSYDDPILVSAITHYGYCPRRCGLVHVDHVFEENVYTQRGMMAHERVDQPVDDHRHGVTVERALPIWSERYGLQGRADVVEFHPDGSVYPVEYKVDSRRASAHDDLQLCAQAVCLEEMLGRPVTYGAVYSGTSRQRREVEFTEALRERTLAAVGAIRSMLSSGILPPPVDDARCPNCSLVHACMPSVARGWTRFDVFHPTDAEAPE